MSTLNICITGATGNVGLETIRFLHALTHNAEGIPANARIIAATPSAQEARSTVNLDRVEYRALDMTKPNDKEAQAQAFQDVQRLFLLRPPHISDVQKYFSPLLQTARECGVQHIVFLSLFGVERQTRTPHYAIEHLLRQSGMNWTFLRPSFFMQNLVTTHREEIALRNEIFVPAGDGKTNFIDARDVGEAAARVLLYADDHRNAAYNLTGAKAYTYHEIALLLSQELGRAVSYKNPSKARFIWRKFVRERTPLMFVLIMTYLYHQTIAGNAAEYAPDLKELLQRKPADLEDFIRRHKTMWQRPSDGKT